MSMRLIEEKELKVRNDDIEILVDRITELEKMMDEVYKWVCEDGERIVTLENDYIYSKDDNEELRKDVKQMKWELDFGKYKRDVK